jgi:hypothetical protein
MQFEVLVRLRLGFRLLLISSCALLFVFVAQPCSAQSLFIMESVRLGDRSWTVGGTIATTLGIQNGTGPFEWALEGNVPPGLNLQSLDGVGRLVRISGRVMTPGTYAFSARVSDRGMFSRGTGSVSYEIVIGSSINFFANTTPVATKDRPFRLDFIVVGGTPNGPCEWSPLAPGLECTLSEPSPNGTNGTVSGTPRESIPQTWLSIPTSLGPAFDRNATFGVNSPIRIWSSAREVTVQAGSLYSGNVRLDGGVSPRTLELTSGSIPPGAQLRQVSTSEFLIEGRLQTLGTYRFAFTANERWGSTDTAEFKITVVPATAPAITSAAPAEGRAGTQYEHRFTSEGGALPVRWSLASGALPEGVALDATSGMLRGLPIQAGTFNFTLTVSDSSNPPLTATFAVALKINPPQPLEIISALALPWLQAGTFSQLHLLASGMRPFEWSASPLPDGLFLRSDGTLEGIPTTTGTYPIPVTVKDAVRQATTRTHVLTVSERKSVILPDGFIGRPYLGLNDTPIWLPVQEGVAGPPAWESSTPWSAPGLRFNQQGVMEGTPSETGVFTFTAYAVGGLGHRLSRDFQITVREYVTPWKTYAIPRNGVLSLEMASTAPEPAVYYGLLGTTSLPWVRHGVAFFEYRRNGKLVSETSVPASEPVVEGRILVDTRTGWDTGIAIANLDPVVQAIVAFTLRDANGQTVASPEIRIPANGQVATFLSGPPFNLPKGFLGTASFVASHKVGVVGIQGLLNEVQDFIMTTLPTMTRAAPQAPTRSEAFVPHFAAGAGWVTHLDLINPASETLRGTVRFQGGDDGSVEPVRILLNGAPSTSSEYSIPPGGVMRILAEGQGTGLSVGSVRISANSGTPPYAILRFSYQVAGVTVSAASLEATEPSTVFRLFVDHSSESQILNGVAIANPSSKPIELLLKLTDLTGVAIATTTLRLEADAQLSRFIGQIPALGLPSAFRGTLEVSALDSASAFVLQGIRGRYNQDGHFILSASYPMDVTASSLNPGLRVFPHLVLGGGYKTTIAIIDFGQPPGDSTLELRDQAGNPDPRF